MNSISTFLIQTLGCKLNQLESEAITDAFLNAGFEKGKEQSNLMYLRLRFGAKSNEQSNLRFGAENREQRTKNKEQGISPTVIIVNTCTVTSKADQKARRVIRKMLRDYPDSKIIVTGCYASLDKEDIQKLDNGDQRLFVIKKENILDFISNIDNFITNNKNNNFLNPCRTVEPMVRGSQSAEIRGPIYNPFSFNPKSFSAHTRSFLKIQDGCNNKCTYCRIRLARGASISLEKYEVLSRLRILEQNHAEAVLTGVNICQYKDNEQLTMNNRKLGLQKNIMNLSGLLEYLLSGTEKIAIRLSSLEPEFVDNNFANVISGNRIRPHFHLSVQSLSEKILKKMGRDYNAQTVENAVALLRSVKDDPFIACDIITGFPGETEKEFKETYSICKKLDFAWIHVFPYSKRPGTAAFDFKDNIHEADVTKRVNMFTELAMKGRANYVRRWLGKEVDVIIEGEGQRAKSKGTLSSEQNVEKCCGTSENYLKVLVRCNDGRLPLPGTVVRCRLVEEGNFEDCDVKAEIMEVIK